jgi:hypothetical protein
MNYPDVIKTTKQRYYNEIVLENVLQCGKMWVL